ncbi:MAG: hypothetical protein ACTSRS_17690 [Candidatus Helarchaeota archaeon]
MKKYNKLISLGILVIMLTVIFTSGFISVNIMRAGSTLGSNTHQNPIPSTFENIDAKINMIYGNPTDLTVQKTETVTIELWPNSSIKSERANINFELENNGDENCSFDLIDRAEYCDLDTIRFQKGTFPQVLPYQVLKSDDDYGVTILKWSNISVSARSKATFGYSIVSYKRIPITVETEYWVNGTEVDIDPQKNELNASVGSFISNIIRVKNNNQPLFSTYKSSKPQPICLITLVLPYEEKEEDRDLDEPIYNKAPIMTTELGPIQQVSWLAIGDVYEVNWSTTVLSGGGWGILELQPIRIDIIQSTDITGGLFDAISSLIGLISGQQLYWAYLTLMAIIKELQGMMGIFELLLNDIQTQLGMLSMVNYSLINCLLISLVELDMVKNNVQTIYDLLLDIYNTNIEGDYGYFNLISVEFRRILGLDAEGLGTNGAIGLGVPYMSLPLILDYFGDIERRIVASFGAQFIEILGSPAIVNFTSTTDDFHMLLNATTWQRPDNSTDFYTLIDIANLSLPIAFGYSMNLTRRYEFQLNVPLDRNIFEFIDAYFGEPVIPFDMFNIPASPGSNVPGFYTWVLDLLRVGQSALWSTIGNLTRSLSTMLLLLDSSFSPETLDMINGFLNGSVSIDLPRIITLETGFNGISDLTNLFSGFLNQFNSPFGNSFQELIPDMSSMNLPISGGDSTLLEKFGFYTALKVYLDPVPRIRHIVNITLPLNLENMTNGADPSSMTNINTGIGGLGTVKSAENGHMTNWDWNYTGLSSASLNQTNLQEGDLFYKRFQFTATGAVDTGNITLQRQFNYSIPATNLLFRIKTDNTNPTLEVRVKSLNTMGGEVYAIQIYDLSTLTPGTWYTFSYDLRPSPYWEYYDPSFDIQTIKGIELRIIPHTISTVNLDVDYINFSRNIIPYPYDMTILDGYLIGDGVEIFPNLTITEKWTSGLKYNALAFTDFNGDLTPDIVAGSNDGYLYLLNGINGSQLWNVSIGGSILNLLLEDLAGNSTPEIVLGTINGDIYVLNSSKYLLWNFTIGVPPDYFLFGNLTGSTSKELIVAEHNHLTVYDPIGTLLWNRTVKGDIRAIQAADLDGDGIDEIALITATYKVYVLNGPNGSIRWERITEERPTHLAVGNFIGDASKELIYSTDMKYCMVLDGVQGLPLHNFTTNSVVRNIYSANLFNNGYNDILVHTGLTTGQNLSAFAGNNFTLQWNLTNSYGFNSIKAVDYLPTSNDEVVVATLNNQIFILNGLGHILNNFSIAYGVNLISSEELTGDGQTDLIFGAMNNHIITINGTDHKPLWMAEMGTEIISFQFIRTNDTIQLYYNLPDPITEMVDIFGISLSGGTEDLTSLSTFNLDMGLNMFGSTEQSSALSGFDLSTLNLTGTNIPLTGLGIMNMLQTELSLIANIQDMKILSSSQKAYTGVPDARYISKDSINYQLFSLISTDSQAEYIQYKVRNYETMPITVQYFGLNMTINGQPLSQDRITLEGWNGTHFVNLANNPIQNLTMAELGIDFNNGKMLFKPSLTLEELEKGLITIDWMGRELRVRINTTGINLNDLSIEPWIDVSIEMSGINVLGVTSVITYSKTHPTIVVTTVPVPNITRAPEPLNPLILMLQNPAFWVFLSIGFVSFMTFDYMKKREEKQIKAIASKKITKWMQKRERSWLTLVQANLMSRQQYFTLKRIRYRLRQENLVTPPIEKAYNRLMQWKLIKYTVSVFLLMRFWRGVNKKSRLIWILGTLEAMVLSPLKHAWTTFKTALGYLNPWDLDRQRKRELLKKAANKRYWKKIEPPKKPIRKKRIPLTIPPSPPLKFKTPPPSSSSPKKLKDWEGEYRTDGGSPIEKFDTTKRLPPIGSRDGQVFYTLSQRKFIGMTLGELAKTLEMSEFEVLISLIRLYEKGLIFLLQEGNKLSDDLWDIGTPVRKQDPELEKLIQSAETLENEIEEGIEYLQTEVKTKNEGSP